jgi:hypothetical protein
MDSTTVNGMAVFLAVNLSPKPKFDPVNRLPEEFPEQSRIRFGNRLP